MGGYLLYGPILCLSRSKSLEWKGGYVSLPEETWVLFLPPTGYPRKYHFYKTYPEWGNNSEENTAFQIGLSFWYRTTHTNSRIPLAFCHINSLEEGFSLSHHCKPHTFMAQGSQKSRSWDRPNRIQILTMHLVSWMLFASWGYWENYIRLHI